jgi:signal transduction histidine kinase
MSDQARRRWRRWWQLIAPAVLAFTMTASVAIVAAFALREVERGHVDAALDRRVQAVRTTVDLDVRRYVDTLEDLSAAAGVRGELTAEDFDTITSRVRAERFPGVGSVLFTDPDGRIRYLRPVDGSDDPRQPADPSEKAAQTAADQRAASGVAAQRARTTARETGKVTASQALGEEGDGVTAVLAAAVFPGPISANGDAPEPAASRGWMLLTLRSGVFLADTVSLVADDVTGVTITDPAAPRPPVLAAGREDPDWRADPALTRSVDLTVAQRTWKLTVAATGPLVTGVAAYADDVTLWGGLIVAGLLGCVTWLLATSRERALARVEQATAALRADIAHRQTVEARLRERESELAGFIAVTAHDLKTPLTNVAAYADLLAEVAAEDLDQTCLGFVERIATGTRRMTRLINDLLDFATADNAPLRMESVDLGALFADVVSEHTAHLGDSRPNIDLGALPIVKGDPGALRRLLDNLISNAIKYVRHGDTAQISVGSRREPDGWRIEVADRGIGIPAQQRQAVFTAFHRDRAAEGYPGTGLGLAICKQIIDRHGGHIGVEANPGGGSRFWFTLPAGSGQETSTPTELAPGDAPALDPDSLSTHPL